MTAAECVSSLCVLADRTAGPVDASDNVVTATNPSSSAAAWSVAGFAPHNVFGISCPTAALCVAVDIHGNRIAFDELALEDAQRQRIEYPSLQCSLERPRPIGRIVTLLGQPSAGACVERDGDQIGGGGQMKQRSIGHNGELCLQQRGARDRHCGAFEIGRP